MLKNDLRLKYTQLRKDLTSEILLHSSLTIANKILELPIWDFKFYHIFLAIPDKKEVDTSFILSILHGKDKSIVVPKVSEKNKLKNYLLTQKTTLKENKWGILEPTTGFEVPENKIDVVFIPLLAFDQNGNRLGYGKGFYDHFLAKCSSDSIKVGLSVFEAEEKISDINTHDVPLDFCVTPETTYAFASP